MPVEQPLEEGARRRRRIDLPRRGQPSTWSDEKPCEIARLSYCHPERSRGIFYVVAVLCTYEVMIKSRGCFGCFSSDALHLTVVQGRFLAALEMTRGGRTVIRGRAFSLLAPPLFLQNAPISLEKNTLEITIPHRYCLHFHTASHRAAARWISLKIKGFPLIFYKFEEKW